MAYWGRSPNHQCDMDNPTQFGCGGHHAKMPWWGLKCWQCFGGGSLGGQRCENCQGTGLVGMTQCPKSANTGTMALIFDGWRWLKERNVFPETGALYDQNHLFVSAYEFLDGISPAYEVEAQQIAFNKVNKNGKKQRD